MTIILYLTITRLNMCYSVHILSQFMQNPSQDHWNVAMRVLRYLKQSLAHGILLTHCSLQLTAYYDSNWASYSMTLRSISGYFIKLGVSPIS